MMLDRIFLVSDSHPERERSVLSNIGRRRWLSICHSGVAKRFHFLGLSRVIWFQLWRLHICLLYFWGSDLHPEMQGLSLILLQGIINPAVLNSFFTVGSEPCDAPQEKSYC